MTRAQPPAFPRQSNGRLGFPVPTEEEACNPHRHSRIPVQLEKIHVVPTSSQDEALAHYSVSGEVPCSALKRETVTDTLRATPKSSPKRRVPSRESRVATRVSWSPLSGLKGVQPPLPFGERTRDCSPGHAPERPLKLHSIPDSQRHPQKLSAVTGTSRVNPGFPAAF